MSPISVYVRSSIDGPEPIFDQGMERILCVSVVLLAVVRVCVFSSWCVCVECVLLGRKSVGEWLVDFLSDFLGKLETIQRANEKEAPKEKWCMRVCIFSCTPLPARAPLSLSVVALVVPHPSPVSESRTTQRRSEVSEGGTHQRQGHKKSFSFKG